MRQIAFLFATAVVLSAGSAYAGENFGSAGTLDFGAVTAFGDIGVLDQNDLGKLSGLNVTNTSSSPPSGSSSSTLSLILSPEVDYFVADNISVGGALLLGYIKPSQGDSVTALGIGPTVGYNLWLTPDFLSFWPRASLSYVSVGGTETFNGQSISVTVSKATVGVFAPFLVHPVKHFHFGIGPYFGLDVSSKISASGNSTDSDKNTVFGIRGEIGGWL